MIDPYASSSLVNCYLNKSQKKTIDEMQAEKIPSITCNDDMIIECNRIADGSLTPVDGFFGENDLDSLIRINKTENGYFFPIPIVLQARNISSDKNPDALLLRDEQGTIIGMLDDASFFHYDLKKLCDYIFGDYDQHHPGVIKLRSMGNQFVGGKVRIFRSESSLSQYCLTPQDSRNEIRKRKWKTCVGFQTRNIPHRSHEYLQRLALEFFDGLLIHPIIGWKKVNDYRPEVVMEVYKYLVNAYYPANRVMLSGLEAQMRYAGPKEAVLHAIIRQNYGCSHFIVGRDHAGVNNYYGKYEAHAIFEGLEKYLGISILKLKGPFYCKKCKCITTENTCGHDARHHIEISGTKIRDLLQASRYPPETLIRKDITDEILKFEDIFI